MYSYSCHQSVLRVPADDVSWRRHASDDRDRYTHPFNDPLSGTTRVSRYQKSKTNLDFNEARDSEWQWRQLGHASLHLAPVR